MNYNLVVSKNGIIVQWGRLSFCITIKEARELHRIVCEKSILLLPFYDLDKSILTEKSDDYTQTFWVGRTIFRYNGYRVPLYGVGNKLPLEVFADMLQKVILDYKFFDDIQNL